jgi:PAS domain S-box-containing protein
VANARAERAAEELGTILASVGDAMMVTDAAGHVVSRKAERLTGWSAEEARGLPLEQAFVILNEQSRARAEIRVMRWNVRC